MVFQKWLIYHLCLRLHSAKVRYANFLIRYLPAIYNPATRTLQIHQSTPLYLLTHRVKRLRPEVAAAMSNDRSEWRARRNDLGEVFGTRKAKSQIKAEERNKVDVGAMQGVKGHLMESIGELEAGDDGMSESSLFSFGHTNPRSKLMLGSGPVLPSENIPVPDMTTDDPSQVYPRVSLIPQAEWSAIDISHILKAKDDKGRSGALPWRRSRWIEDKLRVTVEGPKDARKTNLYVSSECLLCA